eukprot:NODE_140_length_16098_cov_0.678605.p7 type:complete len:324 gc:universal NODE_140_length_16098_cov_0.678605:13259-14230(+)
MTLNIFIESGNTSEDLIKTLKSNSADVGDRFHALFSLRTIFSNNDNLNPSIFIDALQESLATSTPLLQHELCYILGQFQNLTTRSLQIKHLNSVLSGDYSDIVRHEAAEGLGALGGPDALDDILNCSEVMNDPYNLVSDTLFLAVEKYKYELKRGKITSYFDAIDPAPAFEFRNLSKLRKIIENGDNIFEKYSAMFAIRNLIHEQMHGTLNQKDYIKTQNCIDNIEEEAISIIALGFKDSSALLRHEVAYIFGQLCLPSTSKFLKPALSDLKEHPIVRHECAEALGSIGDVDILKQFVDDQDEIVRESCLVGLKMGAYATVEC